ncbi:MAG: glycoside hydrolase family 127 protein [Bacteroidales bacterium]|nr:glycoside hydrolase family 127 protein [Bacteroidales bacterium]
MKIHSLFFFVTFIPGNIISGVENLSRSENISPSIIYFGDWEEIHGQHLSSAPYSNCYFTFRKSEVRWLGSTGPDHGLADIYIDGQFQETVDAFSKSTRKEVILFQREGLCNNKIHTLNIVIKREKNPESTGNNICIDRFESIEPVNYIDWYKESAREELEKIRDGQKEVPDFQTWKQVSNKSRIPENGVKLLPGVLNNCFKRNIMYANHCFSTPTYCDGTGWTKWLPKSNDGRMLQIAANTLRWGERSDMRDIVNNIVSDVSFRQRYDGYSNYYHENESYTLSPIGGAGNSERKNYDRVFWTRGLLDAGLVGNNEAFLVVRKFYDWFNTSPYLGNQLIGSNSTNGTPGGGLVYFSPIGKNEDMINTIKYFDQEYWINELINENPLSFCYYPGDRPHCYDLLTLEAFIDEYRATGFLKYLDAVKGGWNIYNNYYKHVGGITAICENRLYPPGSYYLVNNATEEIPWEEGFHNGETCGSVFWINLNSKLLQLFPEEEKYAAEIEEGIYNTLLACQDAKGYIRYHNILEGKKEMAKCENSCCENSSTGMIAKLPQYIYSLNSDGIFINLFVASGIRWLHEDVDLSLTMNTNFPYDNNVSIFYKGPASMKWKCRIRIPSWTKENISIIINDKLFSYGQPGTYVTIDRIWENGDRINITVPVNMSLHKYTGLNQNMQYDKYALMYGPILMALIGQTHLDMMSEELLGNLEKSYKGNLIFSVDGVKDTKFVPYFLVQDEKFSCYPTLH